MRKFNAGKGVTIVEMMVSLAVFATLVAGVYTVLIVFDSTTSSSLTYIELSQYTRIGIDMMAKELRGAMLNTVSIPNANTIVFQTPSSNSNNIQYSLGGIEGKQLIRTVSGTTAILCNNVEDIEFGPSPFSGKMVSIDLKMQKDSSCQQNLTSFANINVSPRN